jgi:hypothetical protein
MVYTTVRRALSLPVAVAHVTLPEGGSPVGSYGDVSAGGRRGP